MTGYESVGRVIRRGAAVRHVAIQRVVAFYGHRTAALVSADKVIPIPDAISDALALLLILGCDTAKGIGKVPIDPDLTQFC